MKPKNKKASKLTGKMIQEVIDSLKETYTQTGKDLEAGILEGIYMDDPSLDEYLQFEDTAQRYTPYNSIISKYRH